MKKTLKLGALRVFGFSFLLSFTVLPSIEIGSVRLVGGEAFSASKKAKAEGPKIELAGCKTPPAKRRLKSLGQKFFKKVAAVDALTNPEPDKKGNAPEPDFKAAWPKLKKLVDRCEDCSDYEWAQLYQRAAYIRYSLDDISGAIDYFKKVAAKAPNIPASLETQLLMQIAQLLTSEERYKESNQYFDKWEAMCPVVVPNDYFYYKAQNLYLLKQKDESLKVMSRGIEVAELKGMLPKESWYKLQMAIYLDKEDFKSAERVTEILVVKYTNARIIAQLASLYGMNGKNKQQMALLDGLNVVDALKKEGEYKNLAYLYLENEAPYLASRVMKKGVEKKVIKRTSKNLEVWAASLSQAQETSKSLPIMEEAAKKADNGKIYASLSAIYLSADKFQESVASGKKALKKGNLRSEGEVHMYMGSAYLSLERYNKSIASLTKALKDKKYNKYAANLLKYVKGEKKRSDALKKAKLKV